MSSTLDTARIPLIGFNSVNFDQKLLLNSLCYSEFGKEIFSKLSGVGSSAEKFKFLDIFIFRYVCSKVEM